MSALVECLASFATRPRPRAGVWLVVQILHLAVFPSALCYFAALKAHAK